MKSPRIIKASMICATILLSGLAKAQTSKSRLQPLTYKQKIHVDLELTPSSREFQATVTTVDSAGYRIRLHVSNAEKRKCTITIKTASGYIWSSRITDAYYAQTFDLSQLDDGEYQIQVSNGIEVFEKKIILATNSYIKRELKIE